MQAGTTVDTALLKFWEATRLRAEDVISDEGLVARRDGSSSLRSQISLILGRGYGKRSGTFLARGREQVPARTTPSAGALYPFEVLVSIRDGAYLSTYVYDVDAALITRMSACPPIAATDLVDQVGLAVREDQPIQAFITLIARPWRAMAKYGPRGYLYTYLDVGHAASNIALSASAAGLGSTAHLRFCRQQLVEALALSASCREPQIVVTLAGPVATLGATPAPDGPAAGIALPVWRERPPARLEPPGPGEEANWMSLREVSAYYARAAPPRLGRAASVAEPRPPVEAARHRVARPASIRLPRVPAAEVVRDNFGAAALTRNSAKGFLSQSISFSQFAGLFDDLDGTLNIDCAGPGGLGVRARILVRDVDRVVPGVYSYSPSGQVLDPIGSASGPVADDEIVATCMGQAGMRHAAALLYLHTTLNPLLRERDRAGIAEVHFHAAHIAQRLCLNAARHGIGITCVGGFDEVRCALQAHLTDREEVIYLLVAGVSDPGARKLDRAEIAFSHGRTAVEQVPLQPPVRSGADAGSGPC